MRLSILASFLMTSLKVPQFLCFETYGSYCSEAKLCWFACTVVNQLFSSLGTLLLCHINNCASQAVSKLVIKTVLTFLNFTRHPVHMLQAFPLHKPDHILVYLFSNTNSTVVALPKMPKVSPLIYCCNRQPQP